MIWDEGKPISIVSYHMLSQLWGYPIDRWINRVYSESGLDNYIVIVYSCIYLLRLPSLNVTYMDNIYGYWS